MTGSRETSSASFLGLFGQLIACLGRSKVRDSQVKTYPPSQANAEEQLEAGEKYIVTPGRGCTCNETVSSRHRHRQTNHVQHTTCGTTELPIGTGDTNKKDMRVTKVISVHYKEYDLKTAALCVELDVDGWRKSRWLKYQDLIETPGETEVIPGAKDAIKAFGPEWR